MNESDLNRWIKNSFDWAYKIPDPPKMVAISSAQRPFDGFAVDSKNGTIFWEGKLLKGWKAFSFSHIRDHQIANLMSIKEAAKKNILTYPYISTIIALGVIAPDHHKGIALFMFDIGLINDLIQKGKKSFTAKDLTSLFHKHVASKNQRFDIDLDNQVIKEWQE